MHLLVQMFSDCTHMYCLISRETFKMNIDLFHWHSRLRVKNEAYDLEQRIYFESALNAINKKLSSINFYAFSLSTLTIFGKGNTFLMKIDSPMTHAMKTVLY